jgi:hypothetical protein
MNQQINKNKNLQKLKDLDEKIDKKICDIPYEIDQKLYKEE